MATRSRDTSFLPEPLQETPAGALSPALLGFNAQVIQLMLFREALFLSNGSEVALGLALAAWAFVNGAGAFAGWMAGRAGLRTGRLFAGLLALLPLVLILSIHGARMARTLLDVPGGEHLRFGHFSLLALLVLGPVTFLDGFLFTAALDALFRRGDRGRGTAFVYGVESLGSLAGGLIFTFLFVLFLDPFTVAGILFLCNALLLRLPEGTAWFRGTWSGRLLGLTGLGAGLACVVFGPALNRASEERRWERLQPDLTLVQTRETPYQHLAMLRYLEDHSVFGNGHLLSTLRSVSPAESGDWDLAVFPNFAMLQHPDPRRILLIGGGARGYLEDLLAYAPDRVDWVEYDRGLVDLVRGYLIPEEREAMEDDAVRFHGTDGRYFVKTLPPASLDLILLDVPDPVNANLNRYYTREFFEECRRALDRGGVLLLGLSCQPNYIGDEVRLRNGSVYAALRQVFPGVLVTPGTFSFLAAGKSPAALSADPSELVKRYEARGLGGERFSPYLFYTWFEEDDLAWIADLFAADYGAGLFPVNRDDRPVAYFADARLFTRVTGPMGGKDFLGRLEGMITGAGHGQGASWLRWGVLAFPALGLALLLLAALRARRGRGAAARKGLFYLTAAATGFSGIVLEMGILLKYQNGSGYLYSQMGVIIALYMAGLALGALWPGDSPRSAFLASAGAMALGVGAALFLLPFTAEAFPGALFALVTCGAVILLLGASGGRSFRGVSLALQGEGSDSGGLIYTLDILGTCLGGWQAGIILIPAFGIASTLAAAGGVTFVLCLCSYLALSRTR